MLQCLTGTWNTWYKWNKDIAGKFSNFFVNVGPNPAMNIPQSDSSLKSYLPKANAALNKAPLKEG